MSNIMQYLIQIADEFRESYAKVDSRIDEIQDEISTINLKLDDITFNTNPNRQHPNADSESPDNVT